MFAVRQAVENPVPGLNDIIHGTPAGREAFYSHYLPIVTKQVRQSGIVRILNDNLSEDEVAHEVLTKIVFNNGTALEGLLDRTDKGVEGYLRVAVRNHRTDLLRAKANREERLGHQQELSDEDGRDTFSVEDVVEGYFPTRNARPDELVEFKEWAEIVLGSEEEKNHHTAILRLKAVHYTDQDIAEELGVGIKSVGIRVKRARDKVKRELSERRPDLYVELFQ
jgi:DNA-directed RNA polymerase specialized sigma24 family protein